MTTDKESVLTSKDGKVSLKLPAGAFNEEVRVEMQVLPPIPSTGMRVIKLFDITAYATRRKDARVLSLLRDATITIANTAGELRGLHYQSVRLYYLDEKDRRWKPIASQFNAATLILTGTTNHFSYYGEQANPVISGPATIMAFESDMHSGTVKTGYPIELPPGPGGFKPSLQLTYDSGRVDGMKNRRALGSWVGTGWSLSFGFISYDDESGEYSLEIGGAGYEMIRSGDNYHVKPDAFYKIVRDEASQTFEVWDRSGVYYRFGGTADSKQYYNKGYPGYETVYYRWDLNLMRDTHGNEATVAYNQYVWGGSVRSAYPTALKYNKDASQNYLVQVIFDSRFEGYPNNPDPTYGELRNDNPITAGSNLIPPVMENRWLDNIAVKVGNPLQVVRKYTFSYTTTGRIYDSLDYGGIYYSGKHTLTSITQYDGADTPTPLPSMTFSYTGKQVYLRDPDNGYYTGNPGNPTSALLSWPFLTSVTNGYGAAVTFVYEQKPPGDPARVWTRQVVTEKRIDPGIGSQMLYTYFYNGDPEYKGYAWYARYRGFRNVKETDAQGNYTWRYFHTTGLVDGKDWEKVTGREYKTAQRSSGHQTLALTSNTWSWANSDFWKNVPPGYSTPYTFLDQWDGFGSNDGHFNTPWGIAADGSGNLHVVDSGNGRIEKFSNTGAFLLRWSGGQGHAPGDYGDNYLQAPRGIATSGNNIYVADYNGQAVRIYDANGIYQNKWYFGARPSGVAFSSSDGFFYITYPPLYPGWPGNEVWQLNSSGQVLNIWGNEPGEPQFSNPLGIATDGGGYVYVADTGNNRIVKLNSSGVVQGEFNGSPNYSFSGPYGLAIDSSGYIYVADTGNNRVTKWDANFSYANAMWTGFNGPRGIALQGSDMFVTGSGDHRVQKIPLSGGQVTTWGQYRRGNGFFRNPSDVALAASAYATWVVDKTLHEVKKFDLYGNHNPLTDKRIGGAGPGTADGQFNSPSGLGLSPQDGALYVADTGNHRLQKFDSAGDFLNKWGGPNPGSGNQEFNNPGDVAISSSGNMFVADSGNHRIQKLNPSGGYMATFGSGAPGTGDNQFNNPLGVAVFADESIVVADTNNHRLVAFSSIGQLMWKKGKIENGVPVKSTANGEFDTPTRLALDSGGNIYVADKGNSRIQKLDIQGNYLTRFGVKGSGSGAFYSVQGIDVSPAGDFIYAADHKDDIYDYSNQRIKKITLLGEVRLEQTDVFAYPTFKTARTRYGYDGKGNIAALFKDGDTGITTDDSTIWRFFQENKSSPNWILDKVARERIYGENKSSDNGTGFKVETRYFYDGHSSYTDPPTKGDLTKTEKYDPVTLTAINWQKSYDSYGNVASETDANNRTTSYSYDAAYNTFLLTKTLPPVGGNPAMSESYAWDYRGAKMTAETDVNGQTTTYEYDTFYRPVKLIRPGDSSASPTVEHQYQNWGTINQEHINTLRKIDASNNLWSKRYFDGLGRVVQVQARGETGKTIVTTTTFSDRGLVDSEYVPQELVSTSLNGYKSPEANWKRSTSQYDALKRVTQKTKPDGTSVSHAYADWQDTLTNERGKKKTYYNDAFGRLVKVEELDDAFAVYATTTYAYDFLENLIEVKDNALNPTTINYNAFSRKTSMTDPDMGLWSYLYDNQGNLTRQTDALGQQLNFVYDELNRLKYKKLWTYVVTSYTYDASDPPNNYGKGLRTGMDDTPLGAGSLAYKYDPRGRLAEEKRAIDSWDYSTRYTYDAADRLLTTQLAAKQAGQPETVLDTVTQGYNGRGLPSSLSSTANGSMVSLATYNNLALPTQIDLGNNTRSTYGYWDMEQPGGYYGKLWKIKTVKDPLGTPTTLQDVTHTWDATGNLTQRQNLKSGETETEGFGYDFLDRLTSQSDFLFKFGDAGSTSTVNQPWHAAVDGDNTTWVADWGNNRIAKYNPDGAYSGISFGSAYLSNPTGATRDGAGNFYVSSYWDSKVHKFDSAGNHLLEWGGYGTGDSQFRYPGDVVFNPTNSYVYVVDTWNHKVKYFDTSGNLQGWWGGNGAGSGQFLWPMGIGADGSGNIYVADTSNNRIQKFSAAGGWLAAWGTIDGGSGNGQFNGPYDVAVDSAGNIFVADSGNNRIQKLNASGSFITAWGAGASPFNNPRGVNVTASRVYVVEKGASRLQVFDAPTTQGWAYNQIGNLTLRDGVAYTYGNSKPHAVTSAGSTSYVYDANGNMTTRASQTLTWDEQNRLTGVSGGVSYVYDGDGFRVKKTENGVTTLYVNRYYEKNLSTTTSTLYYYLGDKLVAYKDGTNPLKYVHQDHLTGTSITTDTSGTVVGSIKYKPYGETRSSSGALPARKFTGQRLDDIGLYYYGARYYDPGLGRFISPDSIVPNTKNPQHWNRYSYVLNNPLGYVDPSGNWPEFVDSAVDKAKNWWADIVDRSKQYWSNKWSGLTEFSRDAAMVIGEPWNRDYNQKANESFTNVLSPETSATDESFWMGVSYGIGLPGPGSVQVAKWYPRNQMAFRAGLQNLTRKSGKGLEAHHVFPRAYERRFRIAGVDIWDPRYGVWVEANPEHQTWSAVYNKEWESFFAPFLKESRNPTIDQIMAKGRELAKRFGYEVNY